MRVDDHALDYVQKMKRLQSLDMENCMVRDASLEKLEKLPLVQLNLCKTKISVDGMKRVTKSKR